MLVFEGLNNLLDNIPHKESEDDRLLIHLFKFYDK